MIDTFLIKITQLEKLDQKASFFNPLGNLYNELHFGNWQSFKFFLTFTLFLFASGVCLVT